jgi:hypothetical protein
MTAELLGSAGSMEDAFQLNAPITTTRTRIIKTVYVVMIIALNVKAICSLNVPVVNQDFISKLLLDHR